MNKISFEDFLLKANERHKFKYSYDKKTYFGTKHKIKITCPKHGEFWQEVQSHLQGHGCKQCAKENASSSQLISKNEILRRFKEKHGDNYDYSNFSYNGMNSKADVICRIHGTFKITPSKHLQGQGCPSCSNNQRKTLKKFIEESSIVHDNKYDYSKSEYTNAYTKVCITCPKHGEFWQTPHNHIHGKQGCPKCNSSKLEKALGEFLKQNGINYEEQKKFPWLGRMSLDFFIPSERTAIECQGKQHFGIGGWNESFVQIKKRDEKKKELCDKNEIRLLYFSNKKYDKNVFDNLDSLLKEINNG